MNIEAPERMAGGDTAAIGRNGRMVRGAAGLVLALITFGMWPLNPWVAGVCAISSLLLIYEALRGWCLVRACRVKIRG